MPALLNREEILERNPQIDPEEMEEARRLRELIERQGGARKSYELQPPYGGSPRPAAIGDDPDPRTVKLRGWRDR